MKGRYRWLAALSCALVLSATGLVTGPACAETLDLGLRITWCNDAALNNATVTYTVYHSNNNADAPLTSYTDSSGEVVRELTLACEERVKVVITPYGSMNHYQRDYKLHCVGEYTEWVELDAGGGPPPGGDPCEDDFVNDPPIDWHIRVP